MPRTKMKYILYSPVTILFIPRSLDNRRLSCLESKNLLIRRAQWLLQGPQNTLIICRHACFAVRNNYLRNSQETTNRTAKQPTTVKECTAEPTTFTFSIVRSVGYKSEQRVSFLKLDFCIFIFEAILHFPTVQVLGASGLHSSLTQMWDVRKTCVSLTCLCATRQSVNSLYHKCCRNFIHISHSELTKNWLETRTLGESLFPRLLVDSQKDQVFLICHVPEVPIETTSHWLDLLLY